MVTGTYISIITLNVNELNSPIKRHRVVDWIKKQEFTICFLQEPSLRQRTYIEWKWEDEKRYFMQMGNNKKAEVAILISDKIDFTTKAIKKDKEGHYIKLGNLMPAKDGLIILGRGLAKKMSRE